MSYFSMCITGTILSSPHPRHLTSLRDATWATPWKWLGPMSAHNLITSYECKHLYKPQSASLEVLAIVL